MSCSCILPKVPITVHHHVWVLLQSYIPQTSHFHMLVHFYMSSVTMVTLLQQHSHEEPLQETATARSTWVPRLYLTM